MSVIPIICTVHSYTSADGGPQKAKTMGNKQERSKAKEVHHFRTPSKLSLTCFAAQVPTQAQVSSAPTAGGVAHPIYELALIKPSRVVGCCRRHLSEPKLSATCQQIRRECLPIFYGDNTFCFKSSNIHISPGMKHFEIAQCHHVNNYYTLDVNLSNGGYKLEMVCRPNRHYDPYYESAESYCSVNSATLADGRRMLDSLFKGGRTALTTKEMRELLVVLDRRRAESWTHQHRNDANVSKA
ncbi:hypothetical protein LTR27_004630 [Elasticomyces elasticus]|nr:hypothetical protein LTR27_004630 [Elasticomyces elasticus]